MLETLIGKCRQAAEEFLAAFPKAVLTSAKRTRAEQAHAMASNVALNRAWIAQTYKPSVVSAACHQWVQDHKEATTKVAIAAGILSVLDTFTDEELGALSLHLSGRAFDVQFVKGVEGGKMIAFLYELEAKYGGKFLEYEGGLRRLHFQCRG